MPDRYIGGAQIGSAKTPSTVTIMKMLPSRIAGAAATLALGLSFLLPATQVQAAANPAATGSGAIVDTVKGRATVWHADGSKARVTKGMKIGQGAKIATGLGTVSLDLGSHGIVTVQSRSEVTIDALIRNAGGEAGKDTTLFNLTKGGLLGDVKKVSANSNYQVKTAKGVAGIRGTKYLILAVGVFKCANGSLQITLNGVGPGGQPKVFVVNAGSKLDATQVLRKVTNMSASEAAEVVEKASGDGDKGPPRPVTIRNQTPTEVFVSPTAGDNGRLFQSINAGDVYPGDK